MTRGRNEGCWNGSEGQWRVIDEREEPFRVVDGVGSVRLGPEKTGTSWKDGPTRVLHLFFGPSDLGWTNI